MSIKSLWRRDFMDIWKEVDDATQYPYARFGSGH
jgi:hypothetical protein